jgi:hypothetical protein
MNRLFAVLSVGATLLVSWTSVGNAEVSGIYIEARTCQVYTGPCFANGEMGLTGKDAVLAWNIDQGTHQGVDLAGLNIVMLVKSEETLGHEGFATARPIATTMIVDTRATSAQRAALVDFARSQSGTTNVRIARIDAAPVRISLDIGELSGLVDAGDAVHLTTRKAREGDCICRNETAFYPPLAKVENFVPGVSVEGSVKARGLGTRWNTLGERNVYMATFSE